MRKRSIRFVVPLDADKPPGNRSKAFSPALAFTESVDKVLREGFDIESTKEVIETLVERKRVADTDTGADMKEKIQNLEMLISAYNKGILKQQD